MNSSCLQRKYVDLINHASSKWVNWSSLADIRVGAYGSIDQESGDFRVEGNIYDPEFQAEIDEHGVEVNMSDFLPQEGRIEDDFTITSQGVECESYLWRRRRCHEIHDHSQLIDRRWNFTFKHGKRGGVLVMHKPRQILLPSAVLAPLYRIDKLKDKWLITGTHACPAYSMYLSDTAGAKVTVTHMPMCPDTDGGSTWQVDTQTGLIQNGCETSGGCSYMPLFEVKHPFRHAEEALQRELWETTFPPWEPLDEDGGEDPIYVGVEDWDDDF